MKASPAQQLQLLALQEIDNELTRLDHTASHLPQDAALAELAPRLAEARHRHVERTGELEDARTRLGRAESDVAVVEARMARDDARLEQTSSLKDVQGLEAELESLRQRRGDLEDIELGVMEQIEQLEAQVAEAESAKAELQGELSVLDEAKQSELSGIDARRSELHADREQVVSGIDAELTGLYEKQRARYGIGAALLRRGVSLGSNTTLNPADMAEIRKAAPDEVLLCPESSCILVRTEESGL